MRLNKINKFPFHHYESVFIRMCVENEQANPAKLIKHQTYTKLDITNIFNQSYFKQALLLLLLLLLLYYIWNLKKEKEKCWDYGQNK